MRNLTEYEKGFLEGTIDSDGCISIFKVKRSKPIEKRGWQPVVCLLVSNNNKDFLEKRRITKK